MTRARSILYRVLLERRLGRLGRGDDGRADVGPAARPDARPDARAVASPNDGASGGAYAAGADARAAAVEGLGRAWTGAADVYVAAARPVVSAPEVWPSEPHWGLPLCVLPTVVSRTVVSPLWSPYSSPCRGFLVAGLRS